MPCHPARARILKKKGRAKTVRHTPHTIQILDRKIEDSKTQPVYVGIDPGSKHTGIAIYLEQDSERSCLGLIEIQHRGRQISEKLKARSNYRRRRRSNLRYRQPRFLNRGNKKKGWLAPSLMHRVDSTISMIKRIQKYVPVVGIRQELVRFDTQKLVNPEISGIEYQQGTLQGYDIREYLLAKYDRKCVYCDVTGVPLNIDHVEPKSKSGSNRISNLVLACVKCNQSKGSKSLNVFVKDNVRLGKIKSGLTKPLRDAAAVNATRNRLFKELNGLLPTVVGSGGLTKYNRVRNGLVKSHGFDALCVTDENCVVRSVPSKFLTAKVTGRGVYCRTTPDKYGFPRGYRTRLKRPFGFSTGDMVCANVPKGKNKGYYEGRVVVRATGSFDVQTRKGKVQGVNFKYCEVVQLNDGVFFESQGYTLNSYPSPWLKPGVSRSKS
jgi:hypothetical protein